MEIYDLNNNLLQESDIDLQEGHLIDDTLIVESHPAIDYEEEESHYIVSKVYFTDHSVYEPTANDPFIVASEEIKNKFEYINPEDNREVLGMDLEKIIDKEEVQAKAAWVETKEIQRYVPYTDDEKETYLNTEEQKDKTSNLMSYGWDRILKLESDVDEIKLLLNSYLKRLKEATSVSGTAQTELNDINLMLADIIAGDDSE